jgi:Zinc dependent phospholipase C
MGWKCSPPTLRSVRVLFIAVPLALFANDALAWGLETHLFFAQWLLAAVPLVDAELRSAALRLPRLVLAGACLPDLALAGKLLGTPVFRRAHSWSTLRRMAAAPPDDAARALAIGYASHLLADVVAHNAFVPEHERRIARVRHITHAIAEFAMDHHIRGELTTSPSAALSEDRRALIAFVTRVFPCDAALAERAIAFLARADATLRASPLPRACRAIVAFYYRDPAYRFDRYLEAAKAQLGELEPALAARFTDWVSSDPEGRAGDAAADRRPGQHVTRIMQAEHDT